MRPSNTENQDMRVPILVLGMVWAAAALCGQSKFSWQDYCFKNLSSPACKGHDFATKPPSKETAPRTLYKNPFPTPASPSARRNGTPALIEVGSMDWRFADPFATVLAGFNLEGLSASPLARELIGQLGAKQGVTSADVGKLFDGLSGINQAALSLTTGWPGGDKVVVMVTGNVTGLQLPAPEDGMKAETISGSALLMGHATAVDGAAKRVAAKWPTSELARRAEELGATNEFWAIGPAAMIGPQAVSAGMKQFSLAVSIKDRLISDVAFEFSRPPSPDTIRAWQTNLSAAVIEGNVVHVRMSMEANEMREKLAELVASPVGERLADLVKAARYLPVRDTTVPKQTKPVIYGLDDGPRVVNQ
jgi:hypothetical protein